MLKNKSKLSPKTIIQAGVLFCLLVSLLLAGYSWFNYRKYTALRLRFKEKSAQLLSLESDAQALKKFLKQYQQERQRLEEILFSDKDIATFLDKISLFAKKAQVRIVDMKAESIKPIQEVTASLSQIQKESVEGKKPEIAGPGLTALPIRMEIEAGFERIISFLLSLEKYRQLLTLSDVSIKRGNYPVLNCKFTLRLYSLKEVK